jgi:hypothetical protein
MMKSLLKKNLQVLKVISASLLILTLTNAIVADCRKVFGTVLSTYASTEATTLSSLSADIMRAHKE